MLLKEMFSPVGAPTDDQEDIDWLDDLKFYIDNSNKILEDYFFPAIKKHKQYLDHPKAYKLYIRPIQQALRLYQNEYDIEDISEKFPTEDIVKLAQHICKEQEGYIRRKDYDPS